MNLKESIKYRYNSGNLNTSIIRIGELLVVAVLVALGGILYNVVWTVPKLEITLTHFEKRQGELISDVKELSKCLTRHLQESIPKGVE